MRISGTDYNLYLNNEFIIESIEDLERYIRLEVKFFIGKDDILKKLKNTNISLEDFEEIIREINVKNKSKVNLFLISREDDMG